MKLEDLDYALPESLIAQHPAARREDARLLVVDRASGTLTDAVFSRLGEWLRPGDALALNETRVRAARVDAHRASGGRVELLLIRPREDGTWLTLARPAKRARPGERLTVGGGEATVEVTHAGEDGERTVRVIGGDLGAAIRAHGRMPLPPYIHREPDAADLERYQTVFARFEGAVASPTAGLHFSEPMLAALAAAGVRRAPVLLHVGPGTFRPVATADPARHRMDEEYFEIGADGAAILREARAGGGRIVAVGTTSVRALESACDANGGELRAAAGWTRKYILPPYRFQAVDALVTNFHLPRTTLLLLVAAFAGEGLTRRAYQHAVEERYRFYSYGDAMLVV